MALLRIGSRGSQLALWQANHVAELLRGRGHQAEIQVIKTTGDQMIEVALSEIGAKGMFTREIEEALAEERVDLAVHSLKDLPTDLAQEFRLAAVTKREDARDAFVSTTQQRLGTLPRGARVGTSSLRREAQLRGLRSDLEVHPLRGNVDTRLRKLAEGEFEAIILAVAGLKRLGRGDAIREILDARTMCPAAGQGALGIETRKDDGSTLERIKFLDDSQTRAATDCERSLLRTLGGGCQVPIGAYAEVTNGRLHLIARVARPDGSELLTEEGEGTDAAALGEAVAEKLLRRGARQILQEIYAAGSRAPAPQQP